MNNWEKHLRQIGLTESEIKVYFSVLKSGPATVQNIAKDIRLSRVTVYATIDSLTKQGLLTSIEKGKKQFFAAEPPYRIITIAENKHRRMDSLIENMKNNIQELVMMQGGEKPVVKLYEGLEAFAAIQEDCLKTKFDVMYEFGNKDEINRVYPYAEGTRKDFVLKLSKMKIERRIIFLSKEQFSHTPSPNLKNKYLDPRRFNFSGDIFLYGDTVWLSNFKGRQIAVMIKNKELAQTFRVFFDLLWGHLPPSS